MDYSALLRDSFRFFIKYKQLWLFGILMSIFGGGQYSFSVNYRESVTTTISSNTQPFQLFQSNTITSILQNPIVSITSILVLSALIWIFTQTVSSWSRTAIVGIVSQAESDEPVSLQGAIQFSFHRFRPVLGISMLLGLPSLLMTISAVLMGWTMLLNFLKLSSPNISDYFFAIFSSICLMIFVVDIMGFVLEIYTAFAIRANVIENLSLVDSLRSVWHLLRRQFGYAIVTGILLRFAAGIFGFVVAIPALALWVPIAKASMHNEWTNTIMVLSFVFAVYYITFTKLIGGALTSFNETLWTKLYVNLVNYAKNSLAIQPQNELVHDTFAAAVNDVASSEKKTFELDVLEEDVSWTEKYFFFLRRPMRVRGWLYNAAFMVLLGISVLITLLFLSAARSAFKEAFFVCSMPLLVLTLFFYLDAQKIYLKSRKK